MERYFIIRLGACDIDNWVRRWSYYSLLFSKIRFKSVILAARMIEVRSNGSIIRLLREIEATVRFERNSDLIITSFIFTFQRGEKW